MVVGVNPYLVLPLVACLFILLFGGLSLLRREGLSNQFAFEVLILTGIVLLVSWGTGAPLNPILFLILIYLVSMRSRLLVDLANFLLMRGNWEAAESLYRLALRLKPDMSTRLIVLINYGIMRLRQGNLEEAIAMLREVLAAKPLGRLGLKYEAACRYNLALAYRRSGEEAKAICEFNEVISLLPTSPYALGAKAALERGRKKKAGSNETPGQSSNF